LDQAAANIDVMIQNMFPDTAELLLSGWERVLGLTPAAGATIAQRQDACVAKRRDRGGLSRTYFEALAARYGCSIEIVKYRPFQTGRSKIGDKLYKRGIRWCWKCIITDLGSGDPATLQSEIQRLKPAESYVWFT
jgi:uncharacterized protein YmfQ (DUF2313 family)